MATALEKPRRSDQTGVFPETKSGNAVLIETLRRWGIRFFAGVNGGGQGTGRYLAVGSSSPTISRR